MHFEKRLVTAALVVLLPACASLPPQNGRGDVARLAQERGRDASAAGDARVARQLLADMAGRPLGASDAVSLALVNNPRLKAAYAKLGLAAADVSDAGRLWSPTLAASVLFPIGGEPAQVQQRVAAAVLDVAADAEAAYYKAVAAAQIASLREAVANAARMSADLAQRLFDAGNITRLQLNQEQAAAAQVTLDWLKAAPAVADTRAELNIVMGLPGNNDSWQLALRMPAPFADEDAMPELLRLGDSRLDLAAARGRVKLLADALSQGKGRAARAAAQLEQAEAELKALEIDISNAVHKAHAMVANAKASAEQYRTALVPLHESILARTQEQYNFMLVGQFDLLLAKHLEYDAYEGYLAAVRDYWIARAELARAVGAVLPSSSQRPGEVLDVDEVTRPRDSGMPMQHGKPASDGQQPIDQDQHGHHP